MTKILLVEDDPQITAQLRQWFVAEGHTFENTASGEDGLQLLSGFSYDLILLDWNLPDLDGIDVCKRYREAGGNAFIIFLTGQADISSKQHAFELGADDYLTKPFDMRELSVRIMSLFRRPKEFLREQLQIGVLSLDAKNRLLKVGDKSVQLMRKESALLEYLMRHPNRTYGSKDLLKAVWSSDTEATTDTVRSWMRNLREKLDELGHGHLIRTMGKSGYMVEHNPNEPGRN